MHKAGQENALVIPMYMRQRNKKLPHVTNHVQFSELGQITEKVPALDKLEDERRAVVFLHAIQ